MKLNARNYGARWAKVFVDDVEAPRCFEADEKAGIAKCYAVTPEGKQRYAALDPDAPLVQDGMIYEELRGTVEIRFDTPERRAMVEAKQGAR